MIRRRAVHFPATHSPGQFSRVFRVFRGYFLHRAPGARGRPHLSSGCEFAFLQGYSRPLRKHAHACTTSNRVRFAARPKADVRGPCRLAADAGPVCERLFSILGNAVPGRPFFDVFAGTGVIGLEAISRGASETTFVERDFRLSEAIQEQTRVFGIAERANFARSDVYRWVERWDAPDEPVTVFLSPPFADLDNCPEVFLGCPSRDTPKNLAPDSVLVLQTGAKRRYSISTAGSRAVG